MANPVVLSSDKHLALKVITSRGAEYGEDVHFVPVLAEELRSLVLDYAVCLMKNHETGQFGLQALLGFEAGENLFLDGDQWHAHYIPIHVRRQPFMVGVAGDEGTEPTPENMVLTIDTDSKRVQESEGEDLFHEDGRSTPYLANISKMLTAIIPGIKTTDLFIEALNEHELIQQARIDIEFVNGEKHEFEGFYTISDEKLASLSESALVDLHKKGYLQAAHLLLASIGQLQRLIGMKNEQLAAGD